MKKTGRCPKCGSRDIEKVDKLRTGAGMTGGQGLGAGWDIIRGSTRLFEAYVCRSCGFTELYIRGKDLK